MKKVLCIITTLMLILPLSSCWSPAEITSSPTPGQIVTPSNSQVSLPTRFIPNDSEDNADEDVVNGDYEDTESTPVVFKPPVSDTAIFASSYGEILGGYSGGMWLTHSEAASYCGQPMTFYKYNLKGQTGTVMSSGATANEEYGGYVASGLMDTKPEDENPDYLLSIPEQEETEYNYRADPFCFTYLYYAPSERLPKTKVISDTSDIKPIIQKIVDKHIGKVKAKVRSAISADIDNDGQNEIIVNADNNADAYFDYEGDEVWYSITLIIESDGTKYVIDESYCDPVKCPDYEESYFCYVQNVIDIDGDGKCEIVIGWWGWEISGAEVYKYDGKKLTEVMYYSTGA